MHPDDVNPCYFRLRSFNLKNSWFEIKYLWSTTFSCNDIRIIKSWSLRKDWIPFLRLLVNKNFTNLQRNKLLSLNSLVFWWFWKKWSLRRVIIFKLNPVNLVHYKSPCRVAINLSPMFFEVSETSKLKAILNISNIKTFIKLVLIKQMKEKVDKRYL